MKTIREHGIVDRTDWPKGQWDKEPDKIQWMDKATGLPCLIVRNSFGALCGYVGVSKGHPYFEKHYDEADVSAHGGLTFADHCHGNICHTVENGEDDNVWWLGFDCAHCHDAAPGMYRFTPNSSKFGTYRTLKWVKWHTRKLALQLMVKR